VTNLMNTGDVCRRLGLNVTAELLNSLGIAPVQTDKRASLYSEEQWPLICKKVAGYVQSRLSVATPPRPAAKKAKAPDSPPPAAAKTPDLDDDEEL
jgi:hypothetical protein